MSVPVISIFDEVAMQFGDPGRTRISNDILLPIYNAVIRDIGARCNCILYQAYFTIDAASDIYTYPDECTQVTEVEVSTTPDDAFSYRSLLPLPGEVHRSLRQGGVPGADLPTGYFPEPTQYRIYPTPEAEVVRGGRLSYFGLPDEEASYATGVLPFPDFMRNWVVDGMLVRVLFVNKQSNEAADAYRLWAEREDWYRQKLEDRNADSRPSIRLATSRRGMRTFA